MNIELVLPTLEMAGMETITVELALRLGGRGHRVGVTCIQGTGVLEARLKDAGIEVSTVLLPGLRENFIPTGMARHLRSRKPDIVHSHSGAWLKSSFPAKVAGIKGILHTVHGLHDRERWQDLIIMRAGAAFCGKVAAVSGPLAEYLVERVKIPPEKVQPVLNGVDVHRFRPDGKTQGLRESLSLPAGACIVGCVARFSPVKDHTTLLRAFSILAKMNEEAHLVLVGEGELEGSLRTLAADLGIQARVHFVGPLKDTAPAYRDFDIFVLSSTAEGTSMSILEALATAVPVVATAVGGNPSRLGYGDHGSLAHPGRPADLAEKLRELVGNAEKRERVGKQGRGFVVQALSLDAMVAEYERLYETLL